MNIEHFVQEIVRKAKALKDKFIDQKDIPVNWACIFPQSENDYDEFVDAALKIGEVIKETSTGKIFHITPISTVAGDLLLLKIRKPDSTRPEMGDADFTVKDYALFKRDALDKDGFKLIVRQDFEMIELVEDNSDVRVYFSNPTQLELLGIKN